MLVAFQMLWSEKQQKRNGLKLIDFHRARSDLKFQDELHTSSAKMLVSRVRDRIKRTGVSVFYNRDTGFYNLECDLPFYAVQSQKVKTGTIEKKNRDEEILSRISMNTFVSTQELCRDFKVSRQALHPHLKQLVESKKIKMVKRGPRSGYVKIKGPN